VPKTAPLFLFDQNCNGARTGTGLSDFFNEKRYVRETGVETRIAELCAPVAASLGYRLVRVRLTGKGVKTLQIMAENEQGEFTITDCEALSPDLSAVLDLDDPIQGEYFLEVSSPGIDRPLVRLSDFERCSGLEAKIETRQPINGRRRYRGALAGTHGDHVIIHLPEQPDGADRKVEIALSELSDAKLILNDALLEAARKVQENSDQNLLDDPNIELIEEPRSEVPQETVRKSTG